MAIVPTLENQLGCQQHLKISKDIQMFHIMLNGLHQKSCQVLPTSFYKYLVYIISDAYSLTKFQAIFLLARVLMQLHLCLV